MKRSAAKTFAKKTPAKTVAAKTTPAKKTPPKKAAEKVAKKAAPKVATKTSGAMDRKLIALSQPYEVRDWCKSLGCTEAELTAAVQAVGHSAAKVRVYLKER